MSLDIWSRDDIRNAILAANATTQNALKVAAEQNNGIVPPELDMYRRGYEAALMTLAMNFGVKLVDDNSRRGRIIGVASSRQRLGVSPRAEEALARLLNTRGTSDE